MARTRRLHTPTASQWTRPALPSAAVRRVRQSQPRDMAKPSPGSLPADRRSARKSWTARRRALLSRPARRSGHATLRPRGQGMGYGRPCRGVPHVLPTVRCDVAEDSRGSRHRAAAPRQRTSTISGDRPATTRSPTPGLGRPARCGGSSRLPAKVATSRQRVLAGNRRGLRIGPSSDRVDHQLTESVDSFRRKDRACALEANGLWPAAG